MLNNCGGCHSLGTTLLTRKDAAAWTSFVEEHATVNVTTMTADEKKTLGDYFGASFNPNVPFFNIPPELLAGEVLVPY